MRWVFGREQKEILADPPANLHRRPSVQALSPSPEPPGGHADELRQDLRFAVRPLRRQPGYVAVALGICTATAMFTGQRRPAEALPFVAPSSYAFLSVTDKRKRKPDESTARERNGFQGRRYKKNRVRVGRDSRELERETGFEPATSTLARSHSTTELFPPSPAHDRSKKTAQPLSVKGLWYHSSNSRQGCDGCQPGLKTRPPQTRGQGDLTCGLADLGTAGPRLALSTRRRRSHTPR